MKKSRTATLESAEYVSGYIVHLRYADGVEGDVDLTDELWGEVFEPLRNLVTVPGFKLKREVNTITGSTRADLAPDLLAGRVP